MPSLSKASPLVGTSCQAGLLVRRMAIWAAALGLLLGLALVAWAQPYDSGPPPLVPNQSSPPAEKPLPKAEDILRINLEPPAEGEFVLDKARIIDEATKHQINEICAALLREKATPIIVVTIESMAAYGGAGLRIETFAMLLFNQWGIGLPEVNGQVWNTGMLLLVAVGDRKARIELGAGWKRDHDQAAQKIMDELIVPRFREGDYSAGILAGVQGLNNMARGLAIPTAPRPWWHYALMVGVVALAIFTVVSLIRNGSSGWAWLFWGAVLSILGYLLYQLLTSQGGRSGGHGGGYSGGSFGGGFSGGGGATGSW
mgnify:FL=1